MTLKRMDNVLIVVDDLEAVKAFFVELGMEIEGETTVAGGHVDRLIGLQNVRATLVVMRTPDGQGRICPSIRPEVFCWHNTQQRCRFQRR